jgi:hypothetical protein
VRRSLLIVVVLICVLGSACRIKPSPEDQAKINALQIEHKAVKAEIAEAEQKNSALGGGLVKAR